jgi:putative Mg2+ transporter-C (MgtC) family protein
METIWESFANTDIGLPLASSLLTGLLIGIEREVRAKAAGLRTHTLVCFSSTLLMLAAAHQGDWTVDFIPGGDIVADPTRMAHGVLTGNGFLGAGVIFRDGASVHGLTTAASLWITAALGLLYGAGMYSLALTGTIATLTVLVLFRIFYHFLPHPIEIKLKVACDPRGSFGIDALRAILDGQKARSSSISHKMTADSEVAEGRHLEFTATALLRTDQESDRLAAALQAAPGVVAFQIDPVDDSPPHRFAWR